MGWPPRDEVATRRADAGPALDLYQRGDLPARDRPHLPRRHLELRRAGSRDSAAGRLPQEFDLSAHSLTPLKVTTYNGAVFASFDRSMGSFEDYLGPENLEVFHTVFDGKPVRVLAHYRNSMKGNWKLYPENLKDTYHGSLLHAFLVTFGLHRADSQTVMVVDKSGPHGFDLYWTMIGYETDTPEMTAHRIRQGNLMGPAGFIGAEDGEVIEYVQDGMKQRTDRPLVVELGGEELGSVDHAVSEAAIR